MYAIALKMLFGDRGKYIAMIVGVTFAALIMTQQPAIMVGLLSRTYAFVADVSQPDIWVSDPGVEYVEEHKPLREVELGKVRGVNGVAWAAPLYKRLTTIKLPDGQTKTVDMNGIDDATLIGAPPEMLEGTLYDFRKTDSIFIDKAASSEQLQFTDETGTHRPIGVGDVVEINDRRAIVAGMFRSTRNFITQPRIYTTYTRALSYAPPNRRQLTYILVKVKPGANIEEVARLIEERTNLAAYPSKEFQDVSYNYWMKNTGIPINFGIAVTLGFIVGAAIVSQTFFTFINQNAKQYAALKAMGVDNGTLTRMVLLQAAVIGFIGYGLGVGITVIFGLNILGTVLAFRLPPYLLLLAALGVFLIVTITALAAIRRVKRVDPAEVFRA